MCPSTPNRLVLVRAFLRSCAPLLQIASCGAANGYCLVSTEYPSATGYVMSAGVPSGSNIVHFVRKSTWVASCSVFSADLVWSSSSHEYESISLRDSNFVVGRLTAIAFTSFTFFYVSSQVTSPVAYYYAVDAFFP